MALKVGDKAPDFILKTKTTEGLIDKRLSDHFGKKKTLLLFFPAAFTGVCTEEMCSMNEFQQFEGMDCEVLGISVDSPFSQEAWAEKYKIQSTLLSDYEKKVIEDYDVVLEDLAGLGKSSARAVFVIDKEGVIRYSEQTKSPAEMPNLKAAREALLKL